MRLDKPDPKLFEIFISNPFFSLVFLRRRGQRHRTCGAANTRVHLKDARRGVVDVMDCVYGSGGADVLCLYKRWTVMICLTLDQCAATVVEV